MPNNPVQATTDTSTDRVMDRAFELEAHGDNGCAADARLFRALVAERDALRAALRRIVQECGRARGDQGHRDASRFAFAIAYKAAGEGVADGR